LNRRLDRRLHRCRAGWQFDVTERCARDVRGRLARRRSISDEHAVAVAESALVGAHAVDAGAVGIVQRRCDLIRRQRVIADQRLVAAQVVQLLEHDLALTVRALIALHGGHLRLGELGQADEQLVQRFAVRLSSSRPTWRAGDRDRERGLGTGVDSDDRATSPLLRSDLAQSTAGHCRTATSRTVSSSATEEPFHHDIGMRRAASCPRKVADMPSTPSVDSTSWPPPRTVIGTLPGAPAHAPAAEDL
jgi:hypothetical protein